MPVFTAVGAAIFGAGTFLAGATAFGLQMAAGVGLNLLAQQIAGKPATPTAPAAPGFSIQATLGTGADHPRSFTLGWRSTAGSLVYANTWGKANGSPNGYLTQVIALSDMPLPSGSDGLVGLWVNGESCTIDWGSSHADGYGHPVDEYFGKDTDGENEKDNLWVKFYDGTQTAADAFLTDKVSTGVRPFGSTRVGKGIAYAIVTARINDRLFSSLPKFKFELAGLPLYDPSKDSTVGGSGSHRWNNPATWGGDGDDLPAVQIYNLLRGVTYDGDWLYGLQGVTAARLPAAHWIAQIEKCRDAVDAPGGGTEARYRSSIEVACSNDLASTIETLLTACQGRLSETGGVYKLYCGTPDAAVMSFTDDDIISTGEQSFTPFFGLSDTVNGVAATYPSPEEGWNNKPATPIYRTDLEELAGNRRLMADVALDAVPYARQVQQLMREALQEAQRARRHTFTLPPRFWPLEPGDIVEWTSERNGYEDKLFRVDGVVDKANLDVLVDLTEIDPDDYDWDTTSHYVAPVIGPTAPARPPAQAIVDFSAEPNEVTGDTPGVARPGILLTWGTDDLDDIDGVKFEVRRDSDNEVIIRGRCDKPNDGACQIEGNGLLPATDYEVRGIFITRGGNREVEWSGWIAVTTQDIRFGFSDFASQVRDIVQRELQEQIGNLSFVTQRIASAASEQGFANALDKRAVRIVLAEQGVTIAETAQIAETVEGNLAAAYWLTLDVNGYVTGYQLYNGGSGSSTFTIVADKFIVAQPGVSGGDPTPMFAIGEVDGEDAMVFAGNFNADGAIKGVSIEADTITGDHLEADTITVREILSGSATAMVDAVNTASPSSLAVGTTLATVTMTCVTGNVVVMFDAYFEGEFIGTGGATTLTVSLEIDGVEVYSQEHKSMSIFNGFAGFDSILRAPINFIKRYTVSAGSRTFTAKVKANGFHSGGTDLISDRTIVVLESRR